MGDFFNDVALWKSYYQSNDLYRFVLADRNLPDMYDNFKRLLDTYRYEYASYHLLPLINSKDIVIRAMEDSRSMVLSQRTPEETVIAPPPQEEPKSQSQVGVLVNGREINSDAPPMIIEGRTMVPLRSIALEMECGVQWRESDRTMFITSKGKPQVDVPQGSGDLRVVVDGREIKGDVPPILVQERILVPVRVVAEFLGVKVGWDDQNRLVLIRTAVEEKPVDIHPPADQKPPVEQNPLVVHKPPVEQQPLDTHKPPVNQPPPEKHNPPVNQNPPVEQKPLDGHNIPADQGTTVDQKPPAAPQPVVYTVSGLQWDEWTVRSAGNGLPIEKDIRKKEDSPWAFSGDTISYNSTGTQLYHNDYVITRQEFDLSDILVTFEATGTFRSDYGYTGPASPRPLS